jgi:hypothetical protein
MTVQRQQEPATAKEESTAMTKPAHRMLHTANLKSAGYDEKEKVLEIAFHNGQVKAFKGVPHEVARRLFAAPNPASFYEDRIAEEYPVEIGRSSPSDDAAAKLDDLFRK